VRRSPGLDPHRLDVQVLIQVLQAYIFALLSAGYIGAALASEH